MTEQTNPQVAILMGSQSDWPTMKACYNLLRDFGVTAHVRVSSAHRTPDQTAAFAKDAANQGVQVIIAAAGMAAHLAGSVAAQTTLPVIGVPMAAGALQGVDALLATVQMPPGIPVATVGIGTPGAKNAALLALQILALADTNLAQKLRDHKTQLAAAVDTMNQKLQNEL